MDSILAFFSVKISHLCSLYHDLYSIVVSPSLVQTEIVHLISRALQLDFLLPLFCTWPI